MNKDIASSLIFGVATGGAVGAMTAIGALLGLTSFGSIWPVLTATAVIGAFVHNAKRAIIVKIDDRTQPLRKRIEGMRRDVGDIHGLVRLGPYTQELPLPIGGGRALTGDSAALLAREVLVRKPRAILELGSGVSTLILGQILKKNGQGHLLSVDHDPTWANQTRKYVEFLGLQDVVSVVDAPLQAIMPGNEAAQWYAIPKASLDGMGLIDLLIVDGPPQAKDSATQARYPAFPILRGRLSPGAAIFVDDANREAESEMIAKWKSEDPGWNSRWFDTADGVCMLTRAD